jgi:hypothetical protein
LSDLHKFADGHRHSYFDRYGHLFLYELRDCFRDASMPE